VPIGKALEEPSLPEATKQKLRLAQDARLFAESLGLHKTENYTTFVQLDRPYVTYAVSAAPRSELSSYLWSFPIIGDVPYLGFFREDKAVAEARAMKAKGYDAFVRGVTAYSTLGWFKDPLLSSMIDYDDYDLVNTIIHETVHATVFIKSSADFNEQLATFVGNVGSELFYKQREGEHSPTLEHVQLENSDEQRFADFISHEIDMLKALYSEHHDHFSEAERQLRLHEIQLNFVKILVPQMKTHRYQHFADGEMNNARLLLYQTYLRDYSDFARAFAKLEHDFHKFVSYCKNLEGEKDPAATLRQFAQQP
jgi:predicted aminopeptidase